MGVHGATSWIGQPHVKGSSEMTKMLLLTASILGLQFAWGTEQTYGTPYLLSLGLSKSRLSLVWVAGPLSGLIMQPIIGMVSDKSTHRLGRRRPFMIFGTVAVVICLLILGWAKEIAEFLVRDPALRQRATVALAVFDIYVLDFMINIAQSTCRTLIVDTLPTEKQQLGSAWGRLAGIGHLMVYAIGALDLNSWLGNFMGDSQFKKLCVIAALAMAISQGVSCWAVSERVLVRDRISGEKPAGIVSTLRDIYSAILHLPEPIKAICWVQFWQWIGFFPFLFYGSTWVGEIYLRNSAHKAGSDALTEVGRAGSVAMIIFAIISFSASVVLPWLVESPDRPVDSFTPRPPAGLRAILGNATLKKPSMPTAWFWATIVFGTTMLFAPFVSSVGFASLLITICGFPWPITSWAPGSLLGYEVNQMSSTIPQHRRTGPVELEGRSSTPIALHLRHDSDASQTSSNPAAELSGLYFGVLNIYTTIPQFIGTAISWVVFSIFEPGKSTQLADNADNVPQEGGLNGIAICLFIGAVCALQAARSTKRLKTP